MARPCIYSPIRFCNSSLELTGKPGDGVQNFSQLDWVTASLFLMMTKNLQVCYYNVSIFFLRE